MPAVLPETDIHHATEAPQGRVWTLGSSLPRRAGLAGAAVLLLLALGHLGSVALRYGLGVEHGFGVVRLLDLNVEQSLGTWVAAVLHASAAVLSAVAGRLAREQHGRAGWQRNWWLLSAVFALMSVDEVASLHENINALRPYLDLPGFLHYLWVVPAVVAGLAFLAVQLRFLKAHWHPTGAGLVLAGSVFVAGAVGLEMLEGIVSTSGHKESALYGLVSGGQEVLETAGIMIAVVVLLAHVLRGLQGPGVLVRSR